MCKGSVNAITIPKFSPVVNLLTPRFAPAPAGQSLPGVKDFSTDSTSPARVRWTCLTTPTPGAYHDVARYAGSADDTDSTGTAVNVPAGTTTFSAAKAVRVNRTSPPG